ncbi:glycosyltransferase family 4 protein [Patescibacteria group bacterium]
MTLIGIDGNEANVSNRVGSNLYAFELLKQLEKSQPKAGRPLDGEIKFVVYLKDPPLPDMPKQSSNWQYRVVGPKRLWTKVALPFDLYTHHPRPDVFFSPGHYSPLLVPMPLVVSVMDLGFLRFPEQFKKKDLYTLKKWTRGSVSRADHVLAISEFTRSDIIKTYQISTRKVTATPLGGGKRKSLLAKGKSRGVFDKYGIKGKYILFLGTLKPSKNIAGLVRAFKIFNKKLKKNLKLVIAGKKGWLYEDIYLQVRQEKMASQIIFTDFVAEEDKPALLSGAEVFILPSFWEGFGLPALEAMTYGVPVVAARVASLPEVVGRAGVLVDPDDPVDIARGISLALREKKKRGQLSLAQAKKFSWEKCAAQTLGVLLRVTERSRK